MLDLGNTVLLPDSFFLLLVPLREVEGEYTGHRAGFYAKQKPPGQKPVAAGAGMKQAGNTIFFFT